MSPGPRLLGRAETLGQLTELTGWQRFDGALHARYEAPDVPAAVALVGDAFDAAEELDHHPDVDLRWRRVRFRLTTHDAGGVTQLDVELAHRVAAAAVARGASPAPLTPRRVDVGVDSSHPEVIAPVWAAALGRVVTEVGGLLALAVGDGGGELWFQRTDSPATGRNRLHVDVLVQPGEATRRREAVEAAGGRLVSAEHAPAWWVYADQDGNELCICTEEGRGDD